MNRTIKHSTLTVQEYDEAINFYTQKLDFNIIEDTKLSEDKRWVLISPKGTSNFSLLLAKASNEIQKASVGNQSGGRVFLFMNTDNFDRDYHQFKTAGVEFVREPIVESYGKVAVFKDLYGNLWDLIEPVAQNKNYFKTTRIIQLKDGINIETGIKALKILMLDTRNEEGNITFEIEQSIENETEFITTTCCKDKESFDLHLQSLHYKEFEMKQVFIVTKQYHIRKIK